MARSLRTLFRNGEGTQTAGAAPQVALCASAFSPSAPGTRALLPLAAACGAEGMAVRICAGAWRGALPTDVAVARPAQGLTSAARARRFPRALARTLRRRPADCVVGFGNLPGVDIGIVDGELVAGDRRAPLPPGLPADPPAAPGPRTSAEVVLAVVGDDLVAHGVERLLVALSRLPEAARQRCRVVLIGQLAPRFRRAATVLGLADRVAPPLVEHPGRALAAADVAVDLSYRNAANGWLFDAMAAGAAVLTHDGVDEAALVRAAAAGIVLATPYRAADGADALARLVADAPRRRAWQANAARFATAPAHYGQVQAALAAIAGRIGRAGRDGRDSKALGGDAPASA